MSVFISPNLYQIVNALGDSCKLEVGGGKQGNGAGVNTYNYEDHVNGQWVIASVGLCISGKEEYLLLNLASHTYLIAPAATDLKNYAEPSAGINEGPFDERARWNIIPLNNGTGRYIISPSFNKFCLNVHSAAHAKNGNKVILYATKDFASHWFLRLAPGAISNSPRYEETL